VSKRRRAEPEPPEFFIDRSLGSEVVPGRLRAQGLVVHVMADVYPDLDDLDDVVWIREQTELGRVLLTKDRQIRRNEAEKEAVQASSARMFTIPKASLTGAQMADRLVRNRHRIAQRARRPGPYIYLVHEHGLELVFPIH
jgi:PIN domain-containing protein